MKLSEHFELEEFTRSDTAKKYGVKNEPTDVHLRTLIHTCRYFLEPLRIIFNNKYKTYKGKKVNYVFFSILSGYRSKKLNETLAKEGYKPSTTSQHCTGEAVDLEVFCRFTDGTIAKIPYNEVYEDIKGFVRSGRISVDQLICEKDGKMQWVHASYKAAGATVNRKQFLKFNGKKYTEDKK